MDSSCITTTEGGELLTIFERNIFDETMDLSSLWKESKTGDKMPTTNSFALLDLNEHCLRYIGHFLPAKDAYSFGHTCSKLFAVVSKLQVPITITSSYDLRYLHYFRAEVKDITVDTRTSRKFTVNDRMNLLSIMRNCTKITSLDLSCSDSRILSSKCFHNLAHKLIHLKTYLMERSKKRWKKFIASMRNCGNLRSLHIEYNDVGFIHSSDELMELFSIEFPNLKLFHFYTVQDYPDANMLLDMFLRRNNQLEIVKINGPIFGAYVEALRLCLRLKEVNLYFERREVEDLLDKALALNKLPVLETTSLDCHATDTLSSILQQIQTLRELTVKCTLSEDFIQDILGIPQISSLKLIVQDTYPTMSFFQSLIGFFLSIYGFPKTVDRLLYHAPNLTKLTELDLSHNFRKSKISTNDLTKFIQFILKCPKLERIKFNSSFAIDCLYKQLLKCEGNFAHGAREKPLRLEIDSAVMYVPRYSYGRQTDNIVINDYNGYKSNISFYNIVTYFSTEEFDELLRFVLVTCLWSCIIYGIYHAIINKHFS